jgi:hypothetical protein
MARVDEVSKVERGLEKEQQQRKTAGRREREC